jgi:hypothetical protein
MSISLRSLQAAANAGGWSVNELNALFDMRPAVLQNFLQGTFTSTSSTVLTTIGVGTQAAVASGSQLFVELQEGDQITEQGVWRVEGQLYLTGALIAIGAQVRVVASDGLTFLTAAGSYSQMEIDLCNNGAAPVSAYGFASTTASNIAAVTAVVSSVWISGIVQVLGYGNLGIQIAQNFSTGTAVTVGAGSWLTATAICNLEH